MILTLKKTAGIMATAFMIAMIPAVSPAQKITPSPVIVPAAAPGLTVHADRVIASSINYYSVLLITQAQTGTVIQKRIFIGVETVFFDNLAPGTYYAILMHDKEILRIDVRLFLVM